MTEVADLDPSDPDPSAGTDPVLVLRPPINRVERRAITWWMLQGLLVSVPLLAGALIANAVWGSEAPWLLLTIPAAVAVFLVAGFVEPLWRYRVHRWETTDEAIYATTGWVVLEWRAAPLSRVQTVDAIRGPLEQLLGLSTLRVTTASARGSIDIGGLDKDTAARVAEDLTRVAQETPGDAT